LLCVLCDCINDTFRRHHTCAHTYKKHKKMTSCSSLDKEDEQTHAGFHTTNEQYWLAHSTPDERNAYSNDLVQFVEALKSIESKLQFMQLMRECVSKNIANRIPFSNLHTSTPLTQSTSETFFKTCSVLQFQIVLALAIDRGALFTFERLTQLNNSPEQDIYLIRNIYAPICNLVFPHLSPKENKKFQFKRFRFIVSRLNKLFSSSKNSNHCQTESYSIIFDLVENLGYHECKIFLVFYLFRYRAGGELFDMKSPFDESYMKRQLLRIVKSHNYHVGVRCFIEFIILYRCWRSFQDVINFFLYPTDHLLHYMVKAQTMKESIFTLKQCFITYSDLFESPKIIKTKMISKLQWKVGERVQTIDPNIANLIASFLFVTNRLCPRK
jgi:hypothetical protein